MQIDFIYIVLNHLEPYSFNLLSMESFCTIEFLIAKA